MTTEEKAKAYDEALKRAEAAIDIAADKDLVKGVAATIFPELKESEDEKIRKAILEFFKLQDDNTTYSFIPKKSIIAWLEKQKESPKSADSIPSDCVPDAKCENKHNEEGDFVFELRQIISSHRYSDIYGEYTNDEEGMASEILELCKCELEKQKEQKPTEDWKEKRKKECPFRKADECKQYAGVISKCTGACSWVVDYPKLKEIQDKQEQKFEAKITG